MSTTKKLKPTNANIQRVLVTLINSNNAIAWNAITSAMSESVDVKNWMAVRANLQGFIDAGYLARTADVRSEVYTVLKKVG